jgi:glycosyltransferase involved in cell wall biosynthesis
MATVPSGGNFRSLRLAFIGLRGLPSDLPKAGGGERETEAKATRLVKRGHRVLVYCRWHYNRHPASPYQGIRLLSLPSIPTKNLDTVSHSLLATIHACVTDSADIISFHGMGNALFVPLVRLARKRCVVYMDGIDWERPKWGWMARRALQLAANMALRWADEVYVDNRSSQALFQKSFGKSPQVITLGADLWADPGTDLLQQYGLQPHRYLLFVGLLKPDKGVHILINAYEKLHTDIPLIIVGDSPDGGTYVEQLKSTSDKRIHFLGYVYGKAAQQLFANALIYIQPSLMEGNSPALMSAMACQRCVVVSDIDQNLETVGEAGLSFRSNDPDSLRNVLAQLLNNPGKIKVLGSKARERIETTYTWDAVVDQLEQLYWGLS